MAARPNSARSLTRSGAGELHGLRAGAGAVGDGDGALDAAGRAGLKRDADGAGSAGGDAGAAGSSSARGHREITASGEGQGAESCGQIIGDGERLRSARAAHIGRGESEAGGSNGDRKNSRAAEIYDLRRVATGIRNNHGAGDRRGARGSEGDADGATGAGCECAAAGSASAANSDEISSR